MAAAQRFIPAQAGNRWMPPIRGGAVSVHPRASGEQLAAFTAAASTSGSSPRKRGTAVALRAIAAPRRFIPAQAGNSLAAYIAASRCAVHPRASGEQFGGLSINHMMSGSSPRKRGTDRSGSNGRPAARFIPAQAGNRERISHDVHRTAVHPRASGEQTVEFPNAHFADGSSPRKRGTGPCRRHHLQAVRFIPAQAGNSGPGRSSRVASSVHPRASGEQDATAGLDTPAGGSSPRKRGTVDYLSHPDGYRRFIPAQAGNRARPCRRSGHETVHPRASGEQTAGQGSRSHRRGSSPRKRGTDALALEQVRRERFIPAQAGNSARMAIPFSQPSVHPRASGEQGEARACPSRRAGSSPRKRGTDFVNIKIGSFPRFIPAQAGNRPSPPSKRPWLAVHPRASGEQVASARSLSVTGGSSPRKRGTEPLLKLQKLDRRFIPAQAGNRELKVAFCDLLPVHPRASGEQSGNEHVEFLEVGSSPRKRGTVVRVRFPERRVRFIPAQAGNRRR